MRSRKFVPSLNGNNLEDRALLSGFGGGNFDFTRPIVKNPNLPVANINFTSNAYNQIQNALNGVAGNIVKNADNPQAVLNQLTKVTSKVPFGANLRAILAEDLVTLKQGSAISTDDATAVLNDVFQQVLGRDADANAITFGVPAIQGGTTVKELTTLLVTSPEFLSNNTIDGASTADNNAQYVTALYQTILGRAPESSGLAYWEGQLASGVSTSAVATAFVNSDEAATSPNSILQTITIAGSNPPNYYFGAPNADGSLPGPYHANTAQAQVADLIFSDLNAYLDQGEGTTFNVLKSHLNYSTDIYLTFNGRVS